ncbi:acyl carrier protein [Streptomyces fimicarius]|uniref:Polyketide synthase-like phosphopantetheine-binding domain-containing protein n=2 Tax=Streptomyces TaxID=1883 RepID=A0AB33KN29_9ACTN|nr:MULTISPECIES: acyl carrier protein [unclassified Streptomyces]MDX3501022.1 acyl carrier protein [Streptomyces sp. ATCC51928]MDX5521083.1 acyl carrier protein [Streptomyces sp. DE06-01C]
MTTLQLSRTYETEDGDTITMTVPDVAVLHSVDLAERTAILERYVREQLGRVLAVHPSRVDTTGRPMGCLGIGSISGMELQYRMEDALGVELHLQRLLLANSAQELIDCLAWQFGPEGAGKYGTAVAS